MTVEEYSLDTNRSIEEILKKCKELGINASNKDDFLEDDDIIYLFENGKMFRLNCERIELTAENTKTKA